ncbi:hypothetical protein ACLM5J_02505 [Nocardioides sp. Bht2]|uniref:hypothetical protein n=1 Tax=Nocardioides sp. Bht2 TaxID=3392297 RepID=UPI0039B5E0CB
MSDIQRQLDGELDETPPPGFQISDTLLAGRAAVRRRRLAMAGAALSVALIAGGGAWLVADGGAEPQGGSNVVATQPPRPDDPDGGEPLPPPNADEPFFMDPEGRVTTGPGWVITDRVDDPMTGKKALDASSGTEPIVASVAVEITKGDDILWIMGTAESWDSVSTTAPERPADTGFTELAIWTDYQVDMLTTGTSDQLVKIDGEGRLTPLNRIRIHAQQVLPDLGPDFSDQPAAAARLQIGTRVAWVAVRGDGAATDVIFAEEYPARRAEGTMTGFIDFLKQTYGEGEHQGTNEGLR